MSIRMRALDLVETMVSRSSLFSLSFRSSRKPLPVGQSSKPSSNRRSSHVSPQYFLLHRTFRYRRSQGSSTSFCQRCCRFFFDNSHFLRLLPLFPHPLDHPHVLEWNLCKRLELCLAHRYSRRTHLHLPHHSTRSIESQNPVCRIETSRSACRCRRTSQGDSTLCCEESCSNDSGRRSARSGRWSRSCRGTRGCRLDLWRVLSVSVTLSSAVHHTELILLETLASTGIYKILDQSSHHSSARARLLPSLLTSCHSTFTTVSRFTQVGFRLYRKIGTTRISTKFVPSRTLSKVNLPSVLEVPMSNCKSELRSYTVYSRLFEGDSTHLDHSWSDLNPAKGLKSRRRRQRMDSLHRLEQHHHLLQCSTLSSSSTNSTLSTRKHRVWSLYLKDSISTRPSIRCGERTKMDWTSVMRKKLMTLVDRYER